MSETLVTGGHPPDELLTAYAHDELMLADRNEVARHLEHCPGCAREVRIMKAIHNEVKTMSESAEAPATLRGRILSKVRFRPEMPRRVTPYHFLKWGAAAGLLAVLLMAVLPTLHLDAPMMKSAAPVENAAERMAQSIESNRAMPSAPSARAAAPMGGAGGRALAQQSRSFADGSVKGGAMPGSYEQNIRGYDAIYQDRADSAGRKNGDVYANVETLPHVSVPGVTPDDIKKYTHGQAVEDVKRKVAQRADLGVRVNKKLEELQDDISIRIKGQGGYVENADLTSQPNTERTMTMTLRVPVETFDKTITWLSGLGEVTAKTTKGEDVTGTWVDQRATLRQLRAEEIRLGKELDKAKTAALRNELRSRILNLRIQIDRAESAFAYTSKLAALSTINLTLTEEPQARVRGSLLPDMDNMFKSAVSAFMVAVRVPLAIGIWLLVFTPLWLPCVLVYRWATRKMQAS